MANPYRNTGRAGTGNPVNFNIGGTLVKAGKALLKKFTKSKPKPVSNFKPFHRDGVTYDTNHLIKFLKIDLVNLNQISQMMAGKLILTNLYQKIHIGQVMLIHFGILQHKVQRK